jgi:hypothetical protein
MLTVPKRASAKASSQGRKKGTVVRTTTDMDGDVVNGLGASA